MACKTLFVGCGAMGSAILHGALDHGVLTKDSVTVVERRQEKCTAIHEALGICATTNLPDLSDVGLIVLAVKPQVLPSVLSTLVGVKEGTYIVSIAAGVPLSVLEESVPHGAWVRAMPNTPVSVGAGMTAITVSPNVKTELPPVIERIFGAIGVTVIVSEADLDRLGAISGAGPGYCFVIMDALADAGVRIGLPRTLAIQAAAQTLYGAGKLAVESGMHPALLRDQVTSPGGTTIVGISTMEKYGLRTALQEGVVACLQRSDELGKKSER